MDKHYYDVYQYHPFGGFETEHAMGFTIRSLSPQESRVVLVLGEQGRRETTRAEIVELLGVTPKAADHVIQSLRRKGWLERATWGRYLLIPPDQGPDALVDSNLLALASRITSQYYFGFGTAAAHYGLTTQHRNVIFIVTPQRPRRAPSESRRSGSSIRRRASSSDSNRSTCSAIR